MSDLEQFEYESMLVTGSFVIFALCTFLVGLILIIYKKLRSKICNKRCRDCKFCYIKRNIDAGSNLIDCQCNQLHGGVIDENYAPHTVHCRYYQKRSE